MILEVPVNLIKLNFWRFESDNIAAFQFVSSENIFENYPIGKSRGLRLQLGLPMVQSGTVNHVNGQLGGLYSIGSANEE